MKTMDGEQIGNAAAENVPREDYISAGDLEKYSYCPLSWWFSLKKEVSNESLEQGITSHRQIEEQLSSVREKEGGAKRFGDMIMYISMAATVVSLIGISFTPLFPDPAVISRILLILSLLWILAASYFLYRAETSMKSEHKHTYQRLILIFALVSVVIALNSVTLLHVDEIMSYTLEILSLLWLMGASYFLYFELKYESMATKTREAVGVEEEITYNDGGDAGLLISNRYGLTGRPDYIIIRDEAHIPVELKTGRVPKGPFFSHIMQVGAYCILVEEAYGEAPPYGIVRYGEREFEVDYTDDLKSLVLQKIEEMRAAEKTGDVHRNHNRPGKCRSCSRREICPEALA